MYLQHLQAFKTTRMKLSDVLYTVKKRLVIFTSPAGMSLTKLSLAGSNLIIANHFLLCTAPHINKAVTIRSEFEVRDDLYINCHIKIITSSVTSATAIMPWTTHVERGPRFFAGVLFGSMHPPLPELE
jgi:hypothetical protein